MAENSLISWTHHTHNPWWGPNGTRERTSAANWKQPVKWNRNVFFCQDCQAWYPKEGTHEVTFPEVRTSYGDLLDAPRKIQCLGTAQLSRQRVFCASMADVFEEHEALIGWRADLFELIRVTPNLDWLLLTKRPHAVLGAIERAIYYEVGKPSIGQEPNQALIKWLEDWLKGNTPHNVWLGASIEDQDAADKRVLELCKLPAVVRFLSVEPMLGPVDLTRWMPKGGIAWQCSGCLEFFAGSYQQTCPKCGRVKYWSGSHAGNGRTGDFLVQIGQAIHWVICGGESGFAARPMHLDWARSLRDQCVKAGVSFFFKQWGEWAWDAKTLLEQSKAAVHTMYKDGHCHDWGDGSISLKIGKHAAGRVLDGRTWDEFPIVEAGHSSRTIARRYESG